eukprot:366426-Chlamydomonas_euryale.AAC.9
MYIDSLACSTLCEAAEPWTHPALHGFHLQEVFSATCCVLERLLSLRAHALCVAGRPEPLRTWEGIAQVLARKMDSERKYIERLEAQKGSDNAAKQSTNKAITAARALSQLQTLIAATAAGVLLLPTSTAAPHAGRPSLPELKAGPAGSAVKRPMYGEPVPRQLAKPSAWHPKNTLVRNALREITSRQSMLQAQEQANAAALAAAISAANADPDAAPMIAGALPEPGSSMKSHARDGKTSRSRTARENQRPAGGR